MTRLASTFLAIVIAATSVAVVHTQQPAQPDKLFASAQHKETVEGDLKGAIDTYQQVVSRAGSNRALAAQALLRIADCYQKLGDVQARSMYERLVREYSDQRDAVAAARARLGGVGTRERGMADRQVWTGPSVDGLGAVSPDGRYLSFVDWDTGDLAIRDLTTGTNRRLTNKGTFQQSSDFAEMSVFSRDGHQLAYAWWNDKLNKYELRIVRTDTGVSATPKSVILNKGIEWIGPYDWSPDGKWIAVASSGQAPTTQIGIASAADGTLKVLKTVDGGVDKIAFSQDGQYLAYDLPTRGSQGPKDIFLLSLDGSRDIPVANRPEDESFMGWSPDGASLLFVSDRGGTNGLWSLPYVGGRVAEPARLLKADFRSGLGSMNITRAGVLYYSVTTGTRGVQVAEVDFETGKTLVPPTAIAESDLYSHVQPDWSPDGKSLAFKTIDRRDQQTLSILSLDTGEIREIRPTLGIFNRLRWSPDGSFTVQSVGGTKRQGLYRVDPKTGEATPILVRPLEEGGASQASWMPDGRRLVYRRLANGAGSVHLLDVPAGTEREIVAAANLLGLSLSPDGKQITFVDRSSTESTLYVMPIEGGNRQALHKTNSPTLLVNYVDWTPDGKRIVFATNNADDNGPALWTISPSGGQPTRLELRIGNVAGALSPRIHPDGRRIAFGEGNRSTEIWALENFLPAAAK